MLRVSEVGALVGSLVEIAATSMPETPKGTVSGLVVNSLTLHCPTCGPNLGFSSDQQVVPFLLSSQGLFTPGKFADVVAFAGSNAERLHKGYCPNCEGWHVRLNWHPGKLQAVR